MRRLYFDYAASTPIAREVESAMRPYFSKKFGNPSSLHSFGQEAIAALDKSRETIARAIGARFREIIFTGSATEANNLALRGIARRFMIDDLRFKNEYGERENKGYINHKSKFSNPRVIVSAIEHESILETARDLGNDGVEVVRLPVDKNGFVNLGELKKSLDERTILVSVMYANNEIGTVQPIAEISEIIKSYRTYKSYRSYCPLFHTDAVQAFQFLGCDVQKLGIDLMTLSAHKIYGPKGIGALYIGPISPIGPIITGGGQEFGLRSGTENVAAAIGFTKAVELILKKRDAEAERIAGLRDYFWKGLKKIHPQAQLNGIADNELGIKESRNKPVIHNSKFIIPAILNVYFPDYEAQDLLTRLDISGIAASAGSACSARSLQPSYVIKALGYSDERAKKSIRFSFGRLTMKTDIDKALKIIKELI